MLCFWLLFADMAAATMTANFTVRVVISDADIRKVRIVAKPQSVDELAVELKRQLDIDYSFVILYQDPDFDNQLCTLSTMDELQQFCTVRLVSIATESSTDSTEIRGPGEAVSNLRRMSGNWPDNFILPKFDHDIELLLSRGNKAYAETGQLLGLTKAAKSSVLQKLATTVYDIKVYPTEEEFSAVAKALVEKHPCLKEIGSRTSYDGWRNSLQFKMGNYRTEVRRAGGEEVAINGGRRSRYRPDLPAARTGIKKPRRAESNFLPNFPSGDDSNSQQEMQQLLQDECSKVRPDGSVIHTLMQKTFALRRQVIVKEYPRVSTLLDKWPALFIHSEVWSLGAHFPVHMLTVQSLFILVSCGVQFSNFCLVSHSCTWRTHCLQPSSA